MTNTVQRHPQDPQQSKDQQQDVDEDKDQALGGTAYRLLASIALLGIESGQHELALRMADDLKVLRPDLPHCAGIVAMNDVVSGRASDAVHSLQQCLDKFPDFQLGKALLALCLAEAGGSGWQALLETVIDDARDEHAVNLACAVLGRHNPYSERTTVLGASTGQTNHQPVYAVWG